MAAALALQPQKGEKILDLCAAPGGKTCQIAELMDNEGLLIANDPVRVRANELSRNIERMGIRNVVVTSNLPERLAEKFPGFFDRILVDAPCSGEGMFRKDPESKAQWNPDLPYACATRQKQILYQAARMLKPGGSLAYSTCTFNRIENEDVIQSFLQTHEQFSLRPFRMPGLPEASKGMLRIWPHKVKGEGHFVALLCRQGYPGQLQKREIINSIKNEKRVDELLLRVNAELSDWSEDPLFANFRLGSTAVMLPDFCPDLEGITVLRLGLHLGSMIGKTIRPEHALALAAQPKKITAVNKTQANSFRRGEPLPIEATMSGYMAAALDGWPLGWGKGSGGILKNHYPKGIRKLLSNSSQNTEE